MMLTKVILKNYGVYKDEHTFDFSTTSEKPIVLCGGYNGAGKTSLFESILVCLYGSASFEKRITKKEYEKFLLRKIHRYLGSKTCADFAQITVEFLFHHQSKTDTYSISRLWKNDDGSLYEQFLVKKNGKKIETVDEEQWQAFVQELIPQGIAKLFFFDGEKIVKIAKEGNEDVEIESSFNTLLGLDLVTQLQSDIEVNLMRGEKNNQDETQQEFEKLDSEKKDLEIALFGEVSANGAVISDGLTQKLDQKKSKLDEIHKQIKSEEELISQQGGGYAKQRDKLNTEKKVLETKLSYLENEIRLLCEDVLPFSLVPVQIKEFTKQLEKDSQVTKKELEHEILKENLDEIMSEINSGAISSVDSNAQKQISSKLSELFKKQLDSKSPYTGTRLINFSQKQMQEFLNLIPQMDKIIPEKLSKLVKDSSVTSEQLQIVSVALSNAAADDEITPHIKKLNEFHKEVGILDTEIEHLEREISAKTSLLGIHKSRIRGVLDRQFKKKASDRSVKIAKKVQTVLEQYSETLKAKKLQILQGYITESLKVLLHKDNLIESVKIDPKTFAISLYRKNEVEISKEDLSEGEKQMFATAILWALAKTSGRALPFIIDTPLARLDMGHRDNLINDFFPDASHQVMIFSTDAEINANYYVKLLPHISRSYSMKYNPKTGSTDVSDNYFFDLEGKLIAV